MPACVSGSTRPTSDRVREGLASALAARSAFDSAVVLDLFAGTGALGLEALSRGARRVVAVENNPQALRGIAENVRELGVKAELTSLKLDLLKNPGTACKRLADLGVGRFTLVFADPPYAELPALLPLLDEMVQSKLCAKHALFCVEHASTTELADTATLAVCGSYRYGDTTVTLLARPRQMGEGDGQSMQESLPPGRRPSSAVYAGSFDPITNGHVAIIRSGLVAFDRIIVAVLTNTNKKPLFSVDERVEMIADAVGGDQRVEIDRFEHGLLVDYARSKSVRVVLRGLRAVGDFEHELQMANMNRHLGPGIETVFIMANDYFYVSSTLIKEAAALGGDLHGMVPELVERKLREKFGR